MKPGLRDLKKPANRGVRLENGLLRPVKSNPGSGTGGDRNGASLAHRNGEPVLATCPCCEATVRIEGKRLAIVRYTKPTVPWAANGTRLAAKQAIEGICKTHGIELSALWPQNHDPNLAAIRKAAAKAARNTGAAATIIGSILRRNESTINKMAPKREAVGS